MSNRSRLASLSDSFWRLACSFWNLGEFDWAGEKELAQIYDAQGRYTEADAVVRTGVDEAQAAWAKERAAWINRVVPTPLRKIFNFYKQGAVPSLFERINELAEYYRELGRYDETERLLKRAVTVIEEGWGPMNRHLITALYNLSAFHWSQGRFREAEQPLKRALVVQEADVGASHPYVAKVLYDLAVLKVDQGQQKEAERLYLRAHGIDDRLWKGNYSIPPEVAVPLAPFVAMSYSDPGISIALRVNLAKIYCDQARYAEAEPLFQQALAIAEQAPVQHGDALADILASYAELLRRTHMDSAAAEMNARAEAIRRQHSQEED